MKPFFALLTVLFIGISISAQTTQDSIKAAVNLLFDGMRAANASIIHAAFADSAILQTIARNKDGRVIIKNESVKDFAAQVSKLPKDSADERIVFESIKIDGPLASVWTPYKFYYAGKFSHCGVDSYQLIRLNGIWKIQYLVDTRRKQPCD